MLGVGLNPKELLAGFTAKIANNHHALRSVGSLFGGNIISTSLGIIGGLLVARYLGPEETGLFRSFTIPLAYLTFLHLGTFDGLYRQIPYYVGKEMPEKVAALASSAGAWNIFVSTIVSIGFAICALYSLWHHDFVGVVGWISQALCCWGIFFGGYLGATYRTISQFVAIARIQVLQAIVSFGTVFLVPSLRFYGLCIRGASASIAGAWLFYRNRPLKVPFRFDAKALGEVVRIGFPFSFWGSLYSSVWTATESALMLSFGGVTGLGLFAVAAVLREGMNFFPQAVNQVMIPRVVEAFARDESVRNANARSSWLTVGLTGLMVLTILIVSYSLEFLVPIAIPKYTDGIPLMKICLWFSVVQAASLPLNTLFATGRSWLYGRGVIVGLLAFPLATYLLVPMFGGVLAAAMGSLIGRAVRTVEAYVEILLLTRREIK